MFHASVAHVHKDVEAAGLPLDSHLQRALFATHSPRLLRA